MRRHVASPHAWLAIALLLVPAARAFGQLAPPPVENLQCECGEDPEQPGTLRALLTWTNPELDGRFTIEVRRDGNILTFILGRAGAEEVFIDPGLPAGEYSYEVTVIVGLQRSQPRACKVRCNLEGRPPPTAAIVGPGTLVLSPSRAAFAIFDGRRSRNGGGGRALDFEWATLSSNLNVAVESPHAAVTSMTFFQDAVGLDNRVVIRLLVQDPLDPTLTDEEVFTLEILDGGPEQVPLLFPAPPDYLAAVADRPFTLPLMVAQGSPWPDIHLEGDVPPGLQVDQGGGIVFWNPFPRLPDAGRAHLLEVVLQNGGEPVRAPLRIDARFPGDPILLYAFPSTNLGRGDDLGGGGALGEPPPDLPDRAPVFPDIPLSLNPFSPAAESCSVRGIVEDPVDPEPGVLFQPGCNGPTSAGLYRSAGAAPDLADAITSDFSVELWLSQVEDPPAGQDRSFVFSMSDGVANVDVNWLIAHTGASQFEAVVEVGGGASVLSVTAPPDAGGFLHLVFVRSADPGNPGESIHRFFVNGASQPAQNVGGAALKTGWSQTARVTLGNSVDETRPYSGRLHLAAFYGSALPSNLVEFLYEKGPGLIADGEVPNPIADICPDPHEIRRDMEVDGTNSRSTLGAPGGPGGGGAGIGDPDSCPTLLQRPFDWTASTAPSRPDLCVSTVAPDEGECNSRIRIGFCGQPLPMRLSIELKVWQVSVRGVVKTATELVTIGSGPPFIRGDSNVSCRVDISDGIDILDRLFKVPAPFPCADAADANDDSATDISDAVYVFQFLFLGGSPPDPPFGLPPCNFDGADPTPDGLGCASPPSCCPP